MKTKTLIIFAAVFLGIMGLFAWGNAAKGRAVAVQGTPESSTAKSSLVAPEVFYDFGTISMKNYTVTHEFTVTNPTGGAIFVPKLVTSCMCTAAYIVEPRGGAKGPFGMEGMGYVPPANETIPAGESRAIRVVYDPNAHGPAGVGQIDRFVTLTDESGGTIQFEIKALVTP